VSVVCYGYSRIATELEGRSIQPKLRVTVGEQYVDLFAAGAYALEAKLLEALAQPSLAWVFYVLAATGIVVSIAESAIEGQAQLWLRHLATVAVASVLILVPHRIDLVDLTYAAPGRIEALFGIRSGAAPHLTYLLERFGATVASRLRGLLQSEPTLIVPAIASQVDDLVSNPATLNDSQLRANLQIWRNYIVPRLLSEHPDLAVALRGSDLLPALLNPAPPDKGWVGSDISSSAAAVRAALSSSGADLTSIISDESTLLRQVTDAAGADPWILGTTSIQIRMALQPPPTVDPPASGSPAYYDAVARGSALAQKMIDQLPQANEHVDVTRIEQLHELLGRSILYVAAINYLREESHIAMFGSYCQRLGTASCQTVQTRLIQTSAALRVPAGDSYNLASFTTWLKQPLATALLSVASLLLGALASLVVAVLPFLLGVAKAIAILISTVGLWMMLWPGRLRDAISWMVLPVAFVALWSLLFNLWAEVEIFLTAIASVVGHSDYGSFSAGRIMSIAVSVGYLGLPAIALSILSGNALRALNHAGARLETALLMAWRTRRTAMSFGRRWLANSPLARRWNQRAYRAVGLGTLRSTRPAAPRPKRQPGTAGASSTGRSRKAAGTTQASAKKPRDPPDDFKLK
jgi:hypothetical protein